MNEQRWQGMGLDHWRRPKEGTLRPYAAGCLSSPGPDTSRGAQTAQLMCPAVNTPQPPRRPQLAQRGSEAQPAFRRRRSACTPGRRRPGSGGSAPPPAAASGFQSPACGPQTLTCPLRRPRPCSERSSLYVQRAPGTERQVLAPARPRPP